MTAQTQGHLVRKQFLVSESNIDKLESLASLRGTSAAEIVRQAIDAYDPRGVEIMGSDDLMQLVSDRLKESIKATKKANQRVAKTLKLLNQERT